MEMTRAVMGTHFATRVPAYQYPAGTRVPVYKVQHVRALNGYLGSIFITQVVLLPAGTRVPVYSSRNDIPSRLVKVLQPFEVVWDLHRPNIRVKGAFINYGLGRGVGK